MKKNISSESVPCPHTDLPLLQPDEWREVPFGPEFMCSYQILGRRTLVLRGIGFSDLEAEVGSVTFGAQLVAGHMPPEGGYLMIQDWSRYENSSSEARRHFITSVVKDPRLKGILFCNATLSQEFSIRLGKSLRILSPDVRICRTYREAALLAARFERLGRLPRQRWRLPAPSHTPRKRSRSRNPSRIFWTI